MYMLGCLALSILFWKDMNWAGKMALGCGCEVDVFWSRLESMLDIYGVCVIFPCDSQVAESTDYIMHNTAGVRVLYCHFLSLIPFYSSYQNRHPVLKVCSKNIRRKTQQCVWSSSPLIRLFISNSIKF